MSTEKIKKVSLLKKSNMTENLESKVKIKTDNLPIINRRNNRYLFKTTFLENKTLNLMKKIKITEENELSSEFSFEKNSSDQLSLALVLALYYTRANINQKGFS